MIGAGELSDGSLEGIDPDERTADATLSDVRGPVRVELVDASSPPATWCWCGSPTWAMRVRAVGTASRSPTRRCRPAPTADDTTRDLAGAHDRPDARRRRPQRRPPGVGAAAAPTPRPDPPAVPTPVPAPTGRRGRDPARPHRDRARSAPASTVARRSRPGRTGSPPTPVWTSCAGVAVVRCRRIRTGTPTERNGRAAAPQGQPRRCAAPDPAEAVVGGEQRRDLQQALGSFPRSSACRWCCATWPSGTTPRSRSTLACHRAPCAHASHGSRQARGTARRSPCGEPRRAHRRLIPGTTMTEPTDPADPTEPSDGTAPTRSTPARTDALVQRLRTEPVDIDELRTRATHRCGDAGGHLPGAWRAGIRSRAHHGPRAPARRSGARRGWLAAARGARRGRPRRLPHQRDSGLRWSGRVGLGEVASEGRCRRQRDDRRGTPAGPRARPPHQRRRARRPRPTARAAPNWSSSAPSRIWSSCVPQRAAACPARRTTPAVPHHPTRSPRGHRPVPTSWSPVARCWPVRLGGRGRCARREQHSPGALRRRHLQPALSEGPRWSPPDGAAP